MNSSKLNEALIYTYIHVNSYGESFQLANTLAHICLCFIGYLTMEFTAIEV